MVSLDHRLSAVLAGVIPVLENQMPDDKGGIILDGLFVTRTINRFADTSLSSYEWYKDADGKVKDIMVLQETLTFDDGLKIALISIGGSIILLIGGYLIFRRRDLK